MATATQPLALWVDGFSVAYDTGTNLIKSISYTNPSHLPVTVAVLHNGTVLKEELVAGDGTISHDVSIFVVPLSAATPLPSGWGFRVLPG